MPETLPDKTIRSAKLRMMGIPPDREEVGDDIGQGVRAELTRMREDQTWRKMTQPEATDPLSQVRKGPQAADTAVQSGRPLPPPAVRMSMPPTQMATDPYPEMTQEIHSELARLDRYEQWKQESAGAATALTPEQAAPINELLQTKIEEARAGGRQMGNYLGTRVPYLGGVVSAQNLLRIPFAAERISQDKASGADIELVADFIAENERLSERGIGGLFVDILTQIPGFAIEFVSTTPAYAIGRRLGQKAAVKAMKKLLSKKLSNQLYKKGAAHVPGFIAGGLAQTVANPWLIARGVGEAMAEEFSWSTDDQGVVHDIILSERHGDVLSGALEGFGSSAIEMLSERTGFMLTGLMGAVGKKVAPQALKAGIIRKWAKLNPGRTAKEFGKFLERAQWNGVAGEIFEEEVGKAARAGIGIEEWTRTTLDELIAEGLAFMVPGAARAALGVGSKVRELREGEPPAELPGITEAQAQQMADGMEFAETEPAETTIETQTDLPEQPQLLAETAEPEQPQLLAETAEPAEAVQVEAEPGDVLYEPEGLFTTAEEVSEEGVTRTPDTEFDIAATTEPTAPTIEYQTEEPAAGQLYSEPEVAAPQTALEVVDLAVAEGTTDEVTAALARYLLTQVDPDFDANSALEISAAVRETTPEFEREAGFVRRPGDTSRGRILGEARTTLSDNTDAPLRTAVKLYKGHDADTLVEEWYHRAYDRLGSADRAAYQEYHDQSNDGRLVHEHFAQEGKDFFFTRGVYKSGGRFRRIFERVKSSLLDIASRIGGIEGARIDRRIEQMYRAAGQPARKAPPKGELSALFEDVEPGVGYQIRTERAKPRRRQRKPSGHYVGGPQGLDTPAKLRGLLALLKRLQETGEVGQYWYKESAEYIKKALGGNLDEIDKLVQAIAITSPNVSVAANITFALQAYAQYQAGAEITAGKFPDTRDKLKAVLKDGRQWEGRKTSAFYRNLMIHIDKSRVPAEYRDPKTNILMLRDDVTVDVWMMRAFGYEGDGPSKRQYEFVQDEVRAIAGSTGWEASQVQAAIWVAAKARWEAAWPGIRAKAKAAGDWVWTGREGEFVSEEAAKKYRKMAIREIRKTTEFDATSSAFNFADALQQHQGQVSFETTPGTTTNHMPEMATAPWEQQVEAHRMLTAALLNENGDDIAAEKLGMITSGWFEGPGHYLGKVTPGAQRYVIAGKVQATKGGKPVSEDAWKTLEPGAIATTNAYAAIIGIVLKQDAVPWHRPFYAGTIEKQGGVQVRIGRVLTEAETVELGRLVKEETVKFSSRPGLASEISGRLRETEYDPIATELGVAFLETSFIKGFENKWFHGIIKAALTRMTFEGGEKAKVARFGFHSEYLKNNWEDNKNGGSYLLYSGAERSDLQRRFMEALSILIPRVEAAERAVAEKFGWTRDESLNADPRYREAGVERENLDRSAEGTLPEGVAEPPAGQTGYQIRTGQESEDAPYQDVEGRERPTPTSEPADPMGTDGGQSPHTSALRRTVARGTPTKAVKIFEQLERTLSAFGSDVPIRFGRVSRPQLRSEFKEPAQVIRIRQAYNITDATHEMAAAIAKPIFGKVELPPQVRREMQTLAEELDQVTGKKPGLRPIGWPQNEGFKRFMEYYLNRPEMAAKKAPVFFQWFETDLLAKNKAGAAELERAQDMIVAYRKQPALLRGQGQIEDPGSLKARAAKLVQQARRWTTASALYEILQPLKQMAAMAKEVTGKSLPLLKNPYLLAKANRKVHTAVVKEWVSGTGVTDITKYNIVHKPLSEVTAKISPSERKDFVLYLYAQRARALWTDPEGPRNPGLSEADANEIIAEFEKDPDRRDRFERAAAGVYGWNDAVLNYAAQSSPVLGEAVRKIRERDPGNYIPLQRMFADLDNAYMTLRRKGGGSVQAGTVAARLKGSGRPIKDPFPVMIANASKMVALSHQRKVLDAMLGLAGVEGMGRFIEQVPKDFVVGLQRSLDAVISDINSQIKGRGGELQLFEDERIEGQDLASQVIQFYTTAQTPKGQDPVMPVFRDGKWEWYRVSHELFSTLDSVGEIYRLPGVLNLVFGMPARVKRAGTTALRAAFALVTNPSRDILTLYFNTRSHGTGFGLLNAWVSSMGSSALYAASGKRADPFLDMALRLGIPIAQALGQDISHTRRVGRQLFQGRVVKTIDPRNLFDSFREIIQFPELAARVAEAKVMAQKYGWKPGTPLTEEQALLFTIAMKEATTDFTAEGEISRVWNQVVPFANANIQGPRASIRALRRNPAQAITRGLVLTSATLALWWRYKDEEWYRELDPQSKYMFWWIEGPGDELIRIPRPFEIGGIFAALPEMFADAAYHDDPELMKKWFTTFAQTSTPGITPVLPGQIYEQARNRKAFWNSPIVSKRLEGMERREQFDEFTSKLSVFLGDVFNASPKRIDYAIRGLGGPVASDVVSLLGLGAPGVAREREAADIPLLGTLFRRGGAPGYRPRSVQQMYELASEYDRRGRSQAHPETRDERKVRLMFGDAARAIALLGFIRSQTPEVFHRRKLTVEMGRLAAEVMRRERIDRPRRLRGLTRFVTKRTAKRSFETPEERRLRVGELGAAAARRTAQAVATLK